MTRCTTCKDTGKVTEPDERPVDAPTSWHGHRMEPVRVEVECEDCPRCAACDRRLARLVDNNCLITLRTYDDAPLDLEVCDFACLDRLLERQTGVAGLLILGMMLTRWSIHHEFDNQSDMTVCFVSRINVAAAQFMKKMSE